MPTNSLVSGNVVQITLDADDYVTVANAQVFYPGGSSTVTTATQFGPYSGGGAVRIVAGASCTYTLTDATPATAPLMATPAQAAAFPALVSGDGNTASIRIGMIGDSRSDSTDVRLAANTYFTHDWLPIANALAGGPLLIDASGGVGGETTAQMDDNLKSVVAAGCKAATLLAGTNDGWTTIADVNASLVTRRSLTDQLLALGIYVFSMSETPNTTKGAAWHDLAAYFNAQEQAYWRGRRGGEFVDVWTPLLDPATGLGLAANFHDGLHQGITGAWKMGKVLAPRIQARYGGRYWPLASGPRDVFATNPASLQRVPNPTMLGTGGTIGAGNSGTLPNNVVSFGTATVAWSSVARADGAGNDLRAVITGTSGQTMGCYQQFAHAEMTAGTRWMLLAAINIESCTDLSEVSVSCSTSSFSIRANAAIQSGSGLTLASASGELIVQSPEFTIDASVANPTYAFGMFEAKGKTGSAWSAAVRGGRYTMLRLA